MNKYYKVYGSSKNYKVEYYYDCDDKNICVIMVKINKKIINKNRQITEFKSIQELKQYFCVDSDFKIKEVTEEDLFLEML